MKRKLRIVKRYLSEKENKEFKEKKVVSIRSDEEVENLNNIDDGKMGGVNGKQYYQNKMKQHRGTENKIIRICNIVKINSTGEQKTILSENYCEIVK